MALNPYFWRHPEVTRRLCLLVLVGLLAALPIAVRPAHADHERGWQALQQELDLSPDQIKRLKPIFKKYHDIRRGRMQAFHDKMKTVLTADQSSTLERLRAERRSRKAGKPSPGGFKRVIDQLGLSPEQTEQVRAFAMENRERMKADRAQFVTEARAILTADQASRLEQLLKEHEKHRRKQREGTRQGSPSP